MPFKGAKKEILNLYNILQVTQGEKVTTNEHKIAYQEVVRVVDIAEKRRGALGKAAADFLRDLTQAILGYSRDFTIKLTHSFSEGYFLAMCPRYVDPPSNARSVILRWKMGQTQDQPYSCLELMKNQVYLPWFTVDVKEDGFQKCGHEFADYPGLVRHLATRHLVTWLSYRCPWCANLGFEKVKISRHVSTCKSMPDSVVKYVEAMEMGADKDTLNGLCEIARPALLTLAAVDEENKFKKRITLTMTRAEGLWRTHAEHSNQNEKKERWGKSVSPLEKGYSDKSGLFCQVSSKYPKFVRCPTCTAIFLDTQIASKEHLATCGLKGFMLYHAQRSLADESTLSDGDRLIFRCKSEAEKAVKEKYVPTVICTLDGYGGSVVGAKSLKPLADMGNAKPLKGVDVCQKRVRVSQRNRAFLGSVKLLGPTAGELRSELAVQAVNLPNFGEVVRKRKIKVDFSRNMKARCERRTYAKELFP